MLQNAQGLCKRLGDEGCYELSLMFVAEAVSRREFDIVQMHKALLSLGLVREDCFVVNPAGVLEQLCGGQWSVTKEPAGYVTSPSEFEILRFERVDGRTTVAHFVVGDGHGGVEFDPYEGSRTVREGKLVSKRIVRRR